MKARTNKQNKVHVVTLGCAKNLFDSEQLMTQLRANEYEVEHNSTCEDAATVIINTCGFIDAAKEESIETILQYTQAKEEGWIDKLYVTGCLSERYREDLEGEFTAVDRFFGTRELPRLLKTLKADYKKELLGERLLSTPSHYAYLKISEGCNRPCSFCAIPLMRGKHVSTPIEELVVQAKQLAAQGVKELLLIAQDTTFYGLDLYKKRRLADLLNALGEVDGIEWIRIHYAFPTGFPEDVLDVIATHPKVCNYIDMPLQHTSTEILKSMKRGIDSARTEKLIALIREKCPGITLRTTLIAGYPGETEEDFEQMKDWVKRMEFDRLGIFTYSHEEDTTAFALDDTIPQEVKQARADEIMAIQSEISLKKNESKVGKTFKVLIDRVEGEYFVGRTEFDSPEVDNEVKISMQHADYLRVGDFVDATIEFADYYDLHAKPTE